MSTQVLGPKQAHLINVIRSGAYVQCTGGLVRDTSEGEKYCFLGAAAHLFGLDVGGGFLRGDDFKEIGLYNRFGGFREPVEFRGMKFNSLVDMNDGIGYISLTFPEIADYIEQNPSNVFGVSL
jgi:hypothetical protein